MHRDLQAIGIAGLGHQRAGRLDVTRRRHNRLIVIGIVERANGAIISDSAIPLLDNVENRFSIRRQLQGLNHPRVVAGCPIRAQPDEVEAICGDSGRDNARLFFQALK